ncbi:MAG: murein biosynthesis integral membrane protein MurJ [Paracoccaceae bacterium]
MKPIRLISGFLTVGFWTLASRILGMVREILLFSLIGAGPLLDAFFAAFRLPNMFRRFFAEGAFNSAFVPLISKKYERKENATAFANEAMGSLAFILLILTTFAIIFMPAVIWAIANGFVGDERFEITVAFGRVMFPYILLISLAALLSGVLNALGYFAAAAAAPVLLNITIIFGLCISFFFEWPIMTILIYSVPFAGILQLILLWSAAKKAGLIIRPSRPRLSKDMRTLVRVAIPSALANGVLQINLLVGQFVSSQEKGAISWLYGADRLYQLPLGVVGIAIGIVLLPELSRRIANNDESGARSAFNNAFITSMALTIPATVALFIIPLPLISALFQHGQTTSNDAAAMALATSIYALGLPAFVLQKVYQPIYFARGDTKTPFRFAVFSMIVNSLIAFGLMPFYGWIAAPVATSVSAWAMILLLFSGTKKIGASGQLSKNSKSKFIRITISSFVMGLFLWTANYVVKNEVFSLIEKISFACFLILAGAAIYSFFANFLGAFSIKEIRQTIKRN